MRCPVNLWVYKDKGCWGAKPSGGIAGLKGVNRCQVKLLVDATADWMAQTLNWRIQFCICSSTGWREKRRESRVIELDTDPVTLRVATILWLLMMPSTQGPKNWSIIGSASMKVCQFWRQATQVNNYWKLQGHIHTAWTGDRQCNTIS